MSSLLRRFLPHIAALAFVASFIGTRAAEPAAAAEKPLDPLTFFRPGEVLTFKLGYGIFSGAGSMRIETIREETPDGPRIRIVVKTETQGLVDTFYSLNNLVVSLIDGNTGRSLQIATTGNDGKRKTDEVTVFDYEAGKVVHTDKVRTDRSGTLTLPDEPIYDLTVTMLGARVWGLKIGESKEVLAPFGDELYDLRVTALREEKVKTPSGTYDTIVLEPKMIGELKGLFKKGGGFKFYISKGPKPQFVRMDIKTPWGTIVGSLEKVEMKEQPPAPKPDEKKKDANPAP